jgi:hypothetical protein
MIAFITLQKKTPDEKQEAARSGWQLHASIKPSEARVVILSWWLKIKGATSALVAP